MLLQLDFKFFCTFSHLPLDFSKKALYRKSKQRLKKSSTTIIITKRVIKPFVHHINLARDYMPQILHTQMCIRRFAAERLWIHYDW